MPALAIPLAAGLSAMFALWLLSLTRRDASIVDVWWGLGAIALSVPGAGWTLLGPAAMSVLLMRVSGVTLLERSIGRRRPAYADYAERTSAFFPRPPRRKTS